jgi:hypothetical protein
MFRRARGVVNLNQQCFIAELRRSERACCEHALVGSVACTSRLRD